MGLGRAADALARESRLMQVREPGTQSGAWGIAGRRYVRCGFQAGPEMAGFDLDCSDPWHWPAPRKICKMLLLRNEFKSHSRLKAAKRKKALNFFKAFCHLAEQAGFEPAVGY